MQKGEILIKIANNKWQSLVLIMCWNTLYKNIGNTDTLRSFQIILHLQIKLHLRQHYFSVFSSLSAYHSKKNPELLLTSAICKFSEMGNLQLVWDKDWSLQNYITNSKTLHVNKVHWYAFSKEFIKVMLEM